ncbi:MAG TPA: exo-alpha-sialidase [Longimicrobiales bacterium]|nr:exo-alpha-sialidase [Longimicrobiales bacterium]
MQAARVLLAAALTVCAAAVAACGSDEGDPLSPLARVASLTLVPDSPAVFAGTTLRLSVVARDEAGVAVSGVHPEWSTSDAAVATIDSTGLVEGVGAGVTTVVARAGEISHSAPVLVGGTRSSDRLLSGGSTFVNHEEPYLVLDGGTVYVTWKELSTTGANRRVAIVRSDDAGQSWTQPRSLAMHVHPDSGTQTDPWLAVGPTGVLHALHLEYAPETSRLVYARSETAGETWTEPRNVDDQRGFADKGVIHAGLDGSVYVAYVDHDLGPTPSRTVIRRSPDGGETWEPGRVLRRRYGTGQDSELDLAPVLASSPTGQLYIAWWARPEFDILFASSDDGGESWSEPVRLNTEPGNVPFWLQPVSTRPAFPSMTVDAAGTIYAVWPEYATSTWDVFFSRSDDGGGSWSAPVRLNDARLGNQWLPSVAVGADGTLHAAWYDARTFQTDVAYARSTDRGSSWSPNVRVTSRSSPNPNARVSEYLGIGADAAGTAYIVWTDRRDGIDIFFARVAGG